MFDPASISDHAPQPEKAIEKRNEENFLAKYDESFQADVLGMLVHRHSFLKTNAPYLKTDFFANEIHRIFAGVVLDLHKAFPDEPVTWTAIINEFGKKKAGLGIKTEDEHLYLEVLSQIKLPPANPAFIEREIQQFTSLKRMEDALTEAA
ncbi:MAG TPA: hypothetical protein PLM79_17350, partial [Syntrophobacteraceae bacterium]|nr:hypothetical protein [Syntrophobacteraceae bacterium]